MYEKGTVLISGTIGDEQNSQVVVADGKIRGVVWYTSRIEAPLTKQYKVYTGETDTSKLSRIRDKSIQAYRLWQD